jgi:hypothetical protein
VARSEVQPRSHRRDRDGRTEKPRHIGPISPLTETNTSHK